MKQELGWYFPDGERHLPEWMRNAKQMRGGVHQYQLTKYQAALKFCGSRRLAVDVGGHVGQWSKNMAEDFEAVVAFEPVPAYAECWHANMSGLDHAHLFHYALGAAPGVVSLKCGTPGSHGDTFVAAKADANAAIDVEMRDLDSFGLGDVDFIKIDCEGYEIFVLKGGEETIKRDKPCIIVEQKPGRARKFGLGDQDACALLKSWGALLRFEMSGDFCFSW